MKSSWTKNLKLKKNALRGYSTSLPSKRRRDILEYDVIKDGYLKVLRRIVVAMNLSVNNPSVHRIFESDKKWLQRKYGNIYSRY